MNCPSCQHENVSSAKSCAQCGARLAGTCSQCGAETAPTAKFCQECGASLIAPIDTTAARDRLALENPSQSLQDVLADSMRGRLLAHPEGENRLVTVFFSDMSGSVEMTGNLHPEEAAALMNRLLKAMIDVVLKYAGWMDRFLGDGILAVFGVPQAHENDPERAILAAIEIRSAARKLGLDVTAGINTGEVYVGAMGAFRHQVVTVIGPVVNLASRLQGQAEPGQILVGEATYRQTRRAFAFAPRTLQVQGIAQPVAAYLVERALPRPEKTRGIEGLRAELIGREKEFVRLRKVLAELLQGRGRIVSLTGEAGVGKSRLISELKAQVTSDELRVTSEYQRSPPLVTRRSSLLWLEGRCQELEMCRSYALFLDLFRDYLAPRPGQEETTRGALLEATLGNMVDGGHLAAERYDEMIPLLGNLLSVRLGREGEERLRQLPPEQVKHQTFRAVQDFFLALSRQQPVVLVLEDLHWADSLSLELIAYLMSSVSMAALCLICVYRPERDQPCWQLGSRAARQCAGCYVEIGLQVLTPAQTRCLVEALLATDALPRAAWELIVEKTRGNPFFVEEMVRSLVVSGMVYREEGSAHGTEGGRWQVRESFAAGAVPETIQSVILSRVDCLSRPCRQVLQCAAVIGRSFSPRVLEQMMPGGTDLRPALAALEDHELIEPVRAGPEEEYAFKHVLTQETVYETILRRRRAGLHGKVAEAIAELYTDQLEERYEELAYHYALSEAVSKSIDFSLKAGQKASRIYANQEAVRYFEQSLDGCRRLSPDEKAPWAEMDAHEGLGDVLFRTGAHREAEAQFQQALNAASAQTERATQLQRMPSGWTRHQAALAAKLADSIHWEGQWSRAIAVAEAGLAALVGEQFCPEAVNLLEILMRSSWAMDDLERARHYAERIQRILPQIPYFDALYMVHYGMTWVEIKSGNFEAADQWLEVMEKVCREHQNEVGLARCYHGRGDLGRARGDYERAGYWFDKSLEYSERIGDAHLLLEGHGERAQLLILLGRDSGDIDAHMERWIGIAGEMARAGGAFSVTALCQLLGRAYLSRGEMEKALTCFWRAIEWGARPSPAHILRQLEQVYVQIGRHQEFFDLCRQFQQDPARRSESPLQCWHLEPGSPRLASSRVIWQDCFNRSSLGSEWQWTDLERGSTCELLSPEGPLQLRTPPTRRFMSADREVPRLLRPVEGNFAAETCLVDITEDRCHTAGLILWASEGDYLLFGKADAAVDEVCLQVCRDERLETIGRGWLPGAELRLRLERCGALVSAWCSEGGSQWQSCGEARLMAPDPVRVGLFVACPPSMSESVGRFAEFRLFRLEQP